MDLFFRVVVLDKVCPLGFGLLQVHVHRGSAGRDGLHPGGSVLQRRGAQVSLVAEDFLSAVMYLNVLMTVRRVGMVSLLNQESE